ncbi:hypothetical protein BDV18DRAFT_149756 [Aspergillus unguis]
MARLNESTASAEPIEILKRRFVRQNREIARVNSIQSLRIRSLESEVSHLLSENVALREQIITLTQDLERFEAARTLHAGVYDVKARLDTKLVELGSLITELGNLPRRYTKTVRERVEPLAEKRPRASSSTEEVNDEDDEPQPIIESEGRLPVILEDKHFPRQSLSAQDRQELSHSGGSPISPGLAESTRSPAKNLGYEEVQPDAPSDSMAANATLDYTEAHALPPNLETRRKKRICSTTIDQERADAKSTSLLDSRFTRKCGAKRKFSIEDEEDFFEAAETGDDDFEFSRPVQKVLSPRDSLSPQNGLSPTKKTQSHEVKKHAPTKRNVLEPKSTNISILSPVKQNVAKACDHYPNQPILRNNENLVPQNGKGGLRRSRPASPKKPTTPVPNTEADTNYYQRETSAAVKLKSPQLSDAEHAEVSVTADAPNTRTSRRRGAVVSYAEPNLRDKMRRSTNELGPAVSRNDSTREPTEQRRKSSSTKKARNSSMTNGEHEPISYENTEHGTVIAMHNSHAQLDGSSTDEVGVQGSARTFQDPSDDTVLHQRGNTRGYPGEYFDKWSNNSLDADEAVSVTSRKSRRHSSNTKSSGRSTASKYHTSTLDVDGVCNELVNDLSAADELAAGHSPEYKDASVSMVSAGVTRGQRVAARRRSMML